MDNQNCNTEHKNNQHLTSEERHEIEVRRKDGRSVYKIAKHLGRPYNTIKNEIDRDTVLLYDGKVSRYKVDEGYRVYLEHRHNSKLNYRCLETVDFLRYVEQQFKNQKWSFDACVGYAKEHRLYNEKEMVRTKTLYNYADLGLINIKNIDLPEKTNRNTKVKKNRQNKKNLGKSIEERPNEINTREEFGHWSIDSVIGQLKEGQPQVMTIVERKFRKSIWLKVKNQALSSKVCKFF